MKYLSPFFFFAALFFTFSSAEALTVSPVRLEVSGDPGTSITGTFQLMNEEETERTFYVSFENFEAQGEDGTPHFVESNEGLATWVHLLPEGLASVTLAPGATQELVYEINIPAEAPPGGYFAAIFWGTTPQSTDEEPLSVGAKVGILLFLTVNGAIEEEGGLVEFALDTDGKSIFTELPVPFYYRIQNEGADRIMPTGSLKIRNTLGLLTTEITLNATQSNILPSSIRRFEETWGTEPVDETPMHFWDHVNAQWSSFALGYYRAELNVEETTATVGFWIIPWQLGSLVLGGSFLILLFFYTVVRTYNRWIIAQVVSQLRNPQRESPRSRRTQGKARSKKHS